MSLAPRNILPLVALLIAPTAAAQTITEILDETGDGQGATLTFAEGIALDAQGNVYVTGYGSDNVFRVAPDGTITEIVDSSGGILNQPRDVEVDSLGNVFIVGANSNNVLKLAPDGTLTEVVDASGAGPGQELDGPARLVIDSSNNVYVSGAYSDNVLRIEPTGVVTQIIDASGDGTHPLAAAFGMSVDALDNVYVVGVGSHNAFRIDPSGAVTQIIDASGGGVAALESPTSIDVDSAGDVYVLGGQSNNVFRIGPGGSIHEILDASGDGKGNTLEMCWTVVVADSGAVFVSAQLSNNVLRRDPDGTVMEIMDQSDGLGGAIDMVVDAAGRLYVASFWNDKAFRIDGDCDEVFCDTHPENTATLTIDTCDCASSSILLEMTGAPAGQPGYLLVGAGSTAIVDPPGASGELCLGGAAIGRYALDLAITDGAGRIVTDVIDAKTGGGGGNLPFGGNLCSPLGQTWHFQYWFRNGAQPSRFSRSVRATFR